MIENPEDEADKSPSDKATENTESDDCALEIDIRNHFCLLAMFPQNST